MIIERIKNTYRWHITYTIDKIVNTLIWLFLPKSKVIVLNVWLTHRGNKVISVNLGDDLNFAIVTYLSKKRVISYMHSYVSLFKPRNYMCIGSIADTLTNKQSIIWGSGAMYGSKNRTINKPKEVLAVRGPLTRDYLISQGIACPKVYGDPAFLLPFVFPCTNVKKKYKMGLIPHFMELSLPSVNRFKITYGVDVTVIDMGNYRNWRDIVIQICECDFIASSSLHGLIISDAYGIPNVWIRLSDIIMGKDFKYRDYFGGVGRKITAPVDFCKTDIDYNILKDNCLNYTTPTFDTKALINSCPFLKET